MTFSSAQKAHATLSSRRPVWVARAFSFPVMCMFLLGAVVFAFAPRGIGIGEPDIWWRLRNASYILQHHSIPSVETYSFTAMGLPCTNFEWVSDLVFFLAFKILGLQGIVVVYSVATLLIFLGVYYRSCLAGADCKDATVATLGGICLGAVALAPRPLLFGWLCLTGMLFILDHFRTTGRGLWLLPPLFLVWINLHGSWIYGMVILVLTIASGLVQGEWGLVVASRWSTADINKLLLALGASLAALFVNPFGYKLVLFPFAFFRMQGFMQYVEYWRPVDFSTWNGKLAMGLIFALLAAVLFSCRRWRLDEILLVGFGLWSGLSHVRLLDFAAILIVPILAPRLKLFPPYDPQLDKPWLNAIIMIAVVSAIVISFPSEMQLQQQVNNEYPVAALEFIQRQRINGRIFHPAEFGGFIEWKAPELKSFVDGRAVFVENGIFEDCFSALLVRDPFKVLDKYKIEYVLLQPSWPLTYVLEHSADWKLIHADKTAVLFERTSVAGKSAMPDRNDRLTD